MADDSSSVWTEGTAEILLNYCWDVWFFGGNTVKAAGASEADELFWRIYGFVIILA